MQRVRLTNRSAETKRFRFTAAVEWCLWNTVDDTTNFQRNLNIGELEVEGSAVYSGCETHPCRIANRPMPARSAG